jgi:cation:H+ antiporter
MFLGGLILNNFIFLISGLILIIIGSEILIQKSVKLALSFNVSSFIIGITIVAIGTSTPELIVGIVSAITKDNGLAFGAVVGSGITNICLTLGLCSIIMFLPIKRQFYFFEIPIMISTAILMVFLSFNDNILSRFDGIIFIIGYVIFILYVIRSSENTTTANDKEMLESIAEEQHIKPHQKFKTTDTLLLLLSLIILLVAGRLIVWGGTGVAQSFGFSKEAIGVSLVALGTCMPELVASLLALRRKETDIALGNCIGSNIFNILIVLGVSCLINPIAINSKIIIQAGAFIAISVLLLCLSIVHKKIGRFTGILFVIIYFCIMILTLTKSI